MGHAPMSAHLSRISDTYFVLPSQPSVAVWIATVLISRYSSLGALLAALAAPLLYILGDGHLWDMHRPVLGAVGAMSLLLIWRHHENINRLIAGQESKVGKKKK